ncbi:hypothetical protein ACKC9G_11725 [Pokkaliibacter sp. CJK22405]|uniref:hypothetical protein n=1 Tax=Pokkaliibacter sp. CJK22405 TaxID=3384615 RepID=UPI00398477FD
MSRLTFALPLLLVSGSVLAGEAFYQVDADQNGIISVQEAQVSESLSLQFAQLDTDKDGVLSSEEFASFQG